MCPVRFGAGYAGVLRPPRQGAGSAREKAPLPGQPHAEGGGEMSRADEITGWSDPALEGRLLDGVSPRVPWRVVEDFATLTRLSGSSEERRAFAILMGHLDKWGVPYRLHEPMCFISIPGPAGVRCDGTAYHA